MTQYRRLYQKGNLYFFTQVTYQRYPWLCSEIGRDALRTAINHVRQKYPFSIIAFILLPDHFHCLIELPEDDSNFSTRMRLIKTYVTKNFKHDIKIDLPISESRKSKNESNLWQRRFWEHCIRDEQDFQAHFNYIHYNPVKHGLCSLAKDWEFSSFHRYVKSGFYDINWGYDEGSLMMMDKDLE